MSTKQNADQYLYQDGHWIKAGRTLAVVNKAPSPGSTTSIYSKHATINLNQKFKKLFLAGQLTLATVVFTNNTDETLYLVSDVKKGPYYWWDPSGEKHISETMPDTSSFCICGNFRRTRLHRKFKHSNGFRPVVQDLVHRPKCYKDKKAIAPGESVTIYDLLDIDVDYANIFSEGLGRDNSISVYPSTNRDDVSLIWQRHEERYKPVIEPNKHYADVFYIVNNWTNKGIQPCSFCGCNHLVRLGDATKCDTFSTALGVSPIDYTKTIYIVSLNEHQSAKGESTGFGTDEVYFAAKMLFAGASYDSDGDDWYNGRVLAFKFLDVYEDEYQRSWPSYEENDENDD